MTNFNHEKQLIRAITEILEVEVDNEEFAVLHRSLQLTTIRLIVERHNERLQKEEKEV